MTGSHLRPALRSAAPAAAPLAAVAVGVFAEGGYSPGARIAFAAAALVAAVVVLAISRAHVRAAAREPVVLVLLALAAVGALSALWTIGPVGRTLEWALVTAGYAAVAAAAAAVARRRFGVEALAAGLAAIAVVAAAMGLAAAVVFSPSFAERIGGVWRPGGPFEYPPALALLQVSALPALLAGMLHRSRLVGGTAAAGLALAGGVLALSASRVALALAVAVAGAALVLPAATGGARRAAVAAAVALGVAAGVVLALAAGAPPSRDGSYGGRLATLIAVTALAPPLWLAARALLARLRERAPRVPPVRRRVSAVAAVVVLAVAAGSLAYGAAPGRGQGPASGFLHGRADTWRAAVETFADRPLAGTGADAFLTGSARHQGGQTILFAHDLPLELAAELGIWGLALALALYLATGRALWRARSAAAVRLLGPAAAAFLIAGLVDWPWHLAGAGAVWAAAVGALAGSSN
jgi:hypothetical protein